MKSLLQPARFRLLATMASVVPTLVFLGVYLPLAGHGFISDDFRWILNSRLDSLADIPRLFRITDGFYRPIVSLTFGLDRLLFGVDPRPYGWTNVGFVLIAAVLIRQLAITLGLSRGAGTLAGSLWLLNFHGINLSIFWICGRTSLLVACAATACAIFVVKRQLHWALLCLALALFSKEEALTLPFVLAGWLYLLDNDDIGRRLRAVTTWLLGSAVILAAYLALRSSTGAMTPATAPSYYQFTVAPRTVLQNAFQYADRAVTASAIAVVLGLALLRPRANRLDTRQWRIILCAVIWLVGGYGITLFLPVRSSLYVLVPSIGPCLAAAVLVDSFWQSADVTHRLRALVAAILVPVCLIPVYRSRTATVPLADFSAQALRDMVEATRNLPDDAIVVVRDDQTTRINVSLAFGTLLNDAILVETGRRLNVVIDSPGATSTGALCASCVALRLRVVAGRVIISG